MAKELRPVNKYDLKGRLIKKYSSISEASLDNKTYPCHVLNCCRGNSHTLKGFIYKFNNESLTVNGDVWDHLFFIDED